MPVKQIKYISLSENLTDKLHQEWFFRDCSEPKPIILFDRQVFDPKNITDYLLVYKIFVIWGLWYDLSPIDRNSLVRNYFKDTGLIYKRSRYESPTALKYSNENFHIVTALGLVPEEAQKYNLVEEIKNL